MSADEWKRQAAERALALVEAGMKVGLGTGSTAAHFVDLLGAKVQAGLRVTCVPTSEETATRARKLGIALATLEELPQLDLTVDGADEVDDRLRLIKGGGGALLREKIVAAASSRMVVIADASKHVAALGAFGIPVEVVRFGLAATRRLMEQRAAEAGCRGEMRLRAAKDGTPFVTDNGNYILDCAFGVLKSPEALDDGLRSVPGVVETGLFLGLATAAIIAGPDGITTITPATD